MKKCFCKPAEHLLNKRETSGFQCAVFSYRNSAYVYRTFQSLIVICVPNLNKKTVYNVNGIFCCLRPSCLGGHGISMGT